MTQLDMHRPITLEYLQELSSRLGALTFDKDALSGQIGNTPLVTLKRFGDVPLFAKLEGDNPAGSVKDRPAYVLIQAALKLGMIDKTTHIIEPTSGNTGIALAMVCAMEGLDLTLIMPANSTQERKDAMAAYGARLILVENGMEGARDLARQMVDEGKGVMLDQFNNPFNALAHFMTTGPEIWAQTGGKITHFVSAMGTTGTIMGVSAYLKSRNPAIQCIGLQPDEASNIAGIRRWAPEYMPKIFNPDLVDDVLDINHKDAEDAMRALARQEGLFCGVSSGGAAFGARKLAKDAPNGFIVFVVCDRGDRYLSTGLFGQA